MTALAFFRCVPFDAKLSTRACVERHQRAKRGGEAAAKFEASLIGPQRCASCSVGKAHAAGHAATAWDDGAPVELVTITLPAPRSAPKSTGRPPAVDDRRAPRAVEPTESETEAREEATQSDRLQPNAVERAEGEPGADPGARAAEQTSGGEAGDEPESAAAGGAGRAPVSAITEPADDGPARARGRSSESGERELVHSSDAGEPDRDRDLVERVNTSEGRDSSPPGTNHPLVARAEASAEAGPTGRRGQESPEGAPESGAARERGRGERAPAIERRPPMEKTFSKKCRSCGAAFTSHAPAARYCRPECREAKNSALDRALGGESTTTGTPAPKRASKTTAQKVDPRVTAALEYFEELIDQHDAEIQRLCAAANDLATAAGLPAPYEV